MLTLEQAKALKPECVLYHVLNRNADGSPERWRVTGKVKIWKRCPSRVYVPLKRGLYAYGRLTENNLDVLCLTEEEALQKRS